MMQYSEILRQHFSGQPLDQAGIEWFRRRGVPITALGLPLAVMTHAVWFDRCRFEFEACRPSGEPQRAIVFPALNEFGDLADLVAWHPKSNALATWLGRVVVLGEEQIFGPRLGEPLVVHPSPLEWLKASREGVVVVDPMRARPILQFAGPLMVADAAERRRLQEMLTIRPPTIRVAAKMRVAA
jgi:hypothetical protein